MSIISEKLQETESALTAETYDRLRILREKRNQSDQLDFKKQSQIRRMEQEFKKTLEVEIKKRKQLSIEARVMFADAKKLSPFA